MVKPISTLLIAVAVIFLLQSAYADTIAERTGESWITWSWNLTSAGLNVSDPINIWVDSNPVILNTISDQSYSLTGLNAMEEHVIQLTYVNNTTIAAKISKTTYPSTTTYILLVLAFLILLCLIFISNPIIASLFALIDIIFSLYVATTGWTTLGAVSYVGYIFATIAGVILVLNLVELIRGKTKWM